MRRRLSPDGRAHRGEEGGERDGAAPVTTRDLDVTTSDPGAEVPLETDADTPSIATLPLREDAGALTVVGLGGSAGSIAPLQAFFENISPTSGSAYIEAAVKLARHLEQENAAIQRNLRLASSSTTP